MKSMWKKFRAYFEKGYGVGFNRFSVEGSKKYIVRTKASLYKNNKKLAGRK